MSIPKTVVINCAGLGERLGLGKTKALIQINGKPLIHWQLEMLSQVEDLRIVIGYQAKQVIKTVLAKRHDVLFIYNHEYLHTKTATSLYLGSRHGEDLVLSIDGDVLIHPDDMQSCLQAEQEFIGYSPSISTEPVYVSLHDNHILAFSRTKGDYEWIGPALLHSDKLVPNDDQHVYEVLEQHLPLLGKKSERWILIRWMIMKERR